MERSEICGCEHIGDWFYPCPLHMGNSMDDQIEFGEFLKGALIDIGEPLPLSFLKGDNWQDV